ncbi:MAG: hypothetical protein ACRCUY_08465 [Thermoguttaceae bacterium]
MAARQTHRRLTPTARQTHRRLTPTARQTHRRTKQPLSTKAGKTWTDTRWCSGAVAVFQTAPFPRKLS